MNTDDYYITSAGIYSTASGTALKAYTFVGFVKIINLIEVIWLQDDVKTFIVDRTGIYDVNPSGNTIPLCNSIVHMNGQILYGGVKDGFQQLGQGFIGWSEIAFDRFTLSKENTSGFYNPNIGVIYNILPLQDSAIVLGSAGAAQMFYAGHIFGFRDLDIPKIKSVNLCASVVSSPRSPHSAFSIPHLRAERAPRARLSASPSCPRYRPVPGSWSAIPAVPRSTGCAAIRPGGLARPTPGH
jgi:hypothetical protein